MKDKGLDHENQVSFVARLTLTKTEKGLVDGLAKRFKGSARSKQSHTGRALAYLLRIGFQCLMHHGEKSATEPKRLKHNTLARMDDNLGVGIVSRSTAKNPTFYTQKADGSKVWDNDIEEG